MLKHEVTYEDFNGEEITEVLYFHMSDRDLIALEAKYPKGLEAEVNRMVLEDDRAGIFDMFEFLVTNSYGVKSEDGRRFMRDEAVRKEFLQTAAYEAVLSELVTDEQVAMAFFNGLVPKETRADASKRLKKRK